MTLHPHAARWRRSLLRTAVASLAVTSALSVVPTAAAAATTLGAAGKLSRGNFTFGSADRIVNHARSQNQQLRGHTLVWHSRLPGWVRAIRDANTLRSVMNNHINQLAGRWRGQIHSFADGGSGQLRPSVFRDVLGTGFIEEAFRTARAADPAVGNGRYQIINRGTNTALDSMGDATPGSSTAMRAPNNSPNNHWTITSV